MAATVRFLGRLLRGLIAAVALAALVVGLPWALVHYVGWPLPHHVPTLPELQGFLLAPMSTTFLLDFLACACWIMWFAFTLDVLRCTVDVARGARWPDLSGAGPMHTLAGVLVGAVLLSVLGNRPAPPPSGSLSGAWGTGSPVVATAPAWSNTGSPSTVTVRQAVFTTSAADTTATTASTPAASRPVSVIVRAPQNGVHDSLWRIAQRTLGDGDRWPEIWHANEGKPQPGGRTFTQPSLIYPGQELDLPATAAPPPVAPPVNTPPPAPAPTSPPPATSPPTTTPPPASSLPATPAPTTQHAPTTGTGSPSSTREPGFRWEPDLFVGLGLAAAVSAALLVARRRYRARYQPGSGDRDDFPVAPVVYQLRLAHLRAEADDDLDPDEGESNEGERPVGVAPPPALVVGAPVAGSVRRPVFAPGLGVGAGREIALDLATARGLGLVGAGAPAAARALMVAALTAPTRHPSGTAQPTGWSVVVPAEDLTGVLGGGEAHAHLPAALRVAADLDEALDALEAETLVRAAARREQPTAHTSWPALVLVARPPQHHHQRLQAVLDNGAPFGITGLLLGQWQPGVTAYVRADGTISATGPGLGEALRGTRMFRLGDEDTAALLTLLHQAQPDPPAADQPVTPSLPRPRIAPAPPPVSARDNHSGTDHAEDEVELEITAAVPLPAPEDTELEILAPRRVLAPGVRPRPPAAQRGQPAALRASDPDRSRTGAADEPGPAGQDTTTAAEPLPGATAGGETGLVPASISITVLGGLRVHWTPKPDTTSTGDQRGREITGVLQPKTQELLVLLALHPDGVTREALVAALWGQDPPARPTNALHTALSRMRSTLTAATAGTVRDITLVGNGRYQLDPALVSVDYWRFADAVAARRAATTDHARVDAYRDVVESYGGALAEGMSTEWIEPAREAIRRDAIDAVAALARALVDQDPQQTLDLLEIARAFDPHNELLYRDIMRLQERLGQLDAIPRTLTLLTTRLAEIGGQPTPQARGLATRLHSRAAPAQAAHGHRQPGHRGTSAAS